MSNETIPPTGMLEKEIRRLQAELSLSKQREKEVMAFAQCVANLSIWGYGTDDGDVYKECEEPSDGYLDSHTCLMSLIERARAIELGSESGNCTNDLIPQSRAGEIPARDHSAHQHEEISMNKRKYELVLQGFSGGIDMTDDLLLSVEAQMTKKELRQALNQLGLKQDIAEIVALPGTYSAMCIDFPTQSDMLVKEIRRLRDTPISVPRAVLAKLIDMADNHVSDIESGIKEGIYLASENRDVSSKRQVVTAAMGFFVR